MVDTECWEAPRAKISLNVVALRREVLKERREQIRWDPTLMLERSGELLEIRKQIQIVDRKRMSSRWEEEVDLTSRPLITSDEWRTLTINGHITEDWERWNEKDPNGQW